MQDMAAKQPKPPDGSASAVRAAAAAQRSKPAETPAQPSKRVYTAAYKTRVLDELEQVRREGTKGAIGALFRREGLTWPMVLRWEKARQQAGQAALEPKKKGRRPKATTSEERQEKENERLRRQNERLQAELEKARVIIDVQKKLAALLNIEGPADPEKDGTP